MSRTGLENVPEYIYLIRWFSILASPYRASQNPRDEQKYPTILHTKLSNKGFIIQLSCKMEKWSTHKLSCVTN